MNNSGPTEIRYFNVVSHSQQYILWLYVSVHNAIFVQVLYCHTNLLYQIDFLCINFLNSFALLIEVLNQVVKVPVSAVVHDHVKLRALVEKTPQFCDVRMLIKRHYPDLLN